MKWGIIGAGEIAGRSFAPGVKLAPGAKLTAVWRRDLAKAQAFAAQFGGPRAYDSLERMLGDPELDAVYIATPNSLHADHAVMAATAGKHVICEKPMATTVRDAERMIEACERNKVRLGVMFQNRFHPAHLEARRHIQAGALGEVDLASAQLCRGYQRGGHWSGWRVTPEMTGSGAIVAQAVHPIDLLRHLMDSEVVEVQAMTDEAPPVRPVEEMAYCLLRFANGAHASVIAGTLMPRHDNDVLFYGSKAKITCKGTLGVPRAGEPGLFSIEGDAVNARVDYPTDSSASKMARFVEDFSRAVAGNAAIGSSGENGLQMVRIAVALQASSRQGRLMKI
jgi:1,5-anhydro-D-fructose reductase (1,5-anhydro-D-mannitol-forming)